MIGAKYKFNELSNTLILKSITFLRIQEGCPFLYLASFLLTYCFKLPILSKVTFKKVQKCDWHLGKKVPKKIIWESECQSLYLFQETVTGEYSKRKIFPSRN